MRGRVRPVRTTTQLRTYPPASAGRQPGRARLSRDIPAPLGLRLRPKRARGTTTHARMRLECPRSIMEIERGGRRRAGRCPSHVAPCSRRDRRGGRMCVHAACCCVVPVSHRPQATTPHASPCCAHSVARPSTHAAVKSSHARSVKTVASCHPFVFGASLLHFLKRFPFS